MLLNTRSKQFSKSEIISTDSKKIAAKNKWLAPTPPRPGASPTRLGARACEWACSPWPILIISEDDKSLLDKLGNPPSHFPCGTKAREKNSSFLQKLKAKTNSPPQNLSFQGDRKPVKTKQIIK